MLVSTYLNCSWRPITLLNNDYKILTHIFSNRLKEGLPQIISDTQSGFMKGRSIHNNIRLVLDLVEYSDYINDDGFILFLDFYKAFDMVEHPFIFKALELCGFGENFRKTIKCFYHDTTSSVSLLGGTSPRFTINRGIKQGCPISPSLFLIAAEMLSILIKNSEVEKLSVFNNEIVVSQLADDTTLFLKNVEQVPKAIETIDLFSRASGLKLNLEKCELLAIHDCHLVAACGIPVKSTVKYLGVHIAKDNKLSESLNIWSKMHECKSRLDRWLNKDLSLLGRIYITKMESLSRCIYPAYSLSISNKAIKNINKVNFDYIWKRKSHYLKKATLVKDYEDGGLQAIDFDCINGTLKIKWLRSFLANNNSFWYSVSREVFRMFGGIDFVLRCDFSVQKLPVKLSLFHSQTLLYWKMLYKYNFTPHDVSIWNCRFILSRNNSLFFSEWMEKNIWSVTHLLDESGRVLPFDEFCAKFNFQCNRNQFDKVIKSIPIAFLQMVKNTFPYMATPLQLPSLTIDGRDFSSGTLPNKVIRGLLTYTLYPLQALTFFVNQP